MLANISRTHQERELRLVARVRLHQVRDPVPAGLGIVDGASCAVWQRASKDRPDTDQYSCGIDDESEHSGLCERCL